MKYQSILKWLIPPVVLLAFFAAAMGLFYQTPGEPYAYTNHRGESVTINGQGLYAYDTVSSAAQERGNDVVTLFVGLPLLVISAWLAFHGSLRGQLLLTGTFGFFLYTYMSMSMLTSFNVLFLVYVAIFALSLYAFVLCMMSFDLSTLSQHFSDTLPRRWIAGLLFVIAAFLSMAWLGKIAQPLMQNQIADLQNTTTMVIQAMDLTLVVPLAVIAGILLLRRSAWGYLLASVFVLKAITLGLAVSAMTINMAIAGVPESLGIMIPFLVITVINLGIAVLLLRSVKTQPIPSLRQAHA